MVLPNKGSCIGGVVEDKKLLNICKVKERWNDRKVLWTTVLSLPTATMAVPFNLTVKLIETVDKKYFQLGIYPTPFLATTCSFLCNIDYCQVQHF